MEQQARIDFTLSVGSVVGYGLVPLVTDPSLANHFVNFERIVDPTGTSTMKCLACVHAAQELTGDKWFRDAAFKYLRQIIQSGRLPWPGKSYEPSHNMFYSAMLCDYWSETEMAG